ncbi:MAG: DUF1365 domain-containing protein [Phycisphaerae bacterium]|nr:MAG: DUF1365 domain-containing protein [Phycisphaerae bacterium]
MHSAIYEGRVRHKRFTPVEHVFDYALFMMYLDLDELPNLFDNYRLWSNDGRGIARFRRRDHLKGHAPPTQDLRQAVRDLVAKQTGVAPSGPIRLLTHLEYFRYRFNPVSLFFCFDANDQHVESIVIEINNTPWKEQHCYVHSILNRSVPSDATRFEFGKEFHISPFVGMNMEYDWRFSQPGEKLGVVMDTLHKGEKHLNATMTMQRQKITSASLNRVLYRYPLMTLRVLYAIYWQALRLRLKGCPRYTHPATLARQNRGVKTC